MSHPEEMNKLSKLKAQITEVKGIMMDNIEKVHFQSHTLIINEITIRCRVVVSVLNKNSNVSFTYPLIAIGHFTPSSLSLLGLSIFWFSC